MPRVRAATGAERQVVAARNAERSSNLAAISSSLLSRRCSQIYDVQLATPPSRSNDAIRVFVIQNKFDHNGDSEAKFNIYFFSSRRFVKENDQCLKCNWKNKFQLNAEEKSLAV